MIAAPTAAVSPAALFFCRLGHGTHNFPGLGIGYGGNGYREPDGIRRIIERHGHAQWHVKVGKHSRCFHLRYHQLYLISGDLVQKQVLKGAQTFTGNAKYELERFGPVIVLEPMNKFPVIRDLVVDRQRLFRGLTRVKAWVPVDSYYNMGPGERQSQAAQEQNYPLSQCMSCGCCVDACPQYTKVEVERYDQESDEAYERRKAEAYDQAFVGPHAISQAVLFNNHPTGRALASERMEALVGPGGIQACGNAQNCVPVCPKEIPLTTSIARAGRAATLHVIKKWFEK